MRSITRLKSTIEIAKGHRPTPRISPFCVSVSENSRPQSSISIVRTMKPKAVVTRAMKEPRKRRRWAAVGAAAEVGELMRAEDRLARGPAQTPAGERPVAGRSGFVVERDHAVEAAVEHGEHDLLDLLVLGVRQVDVARGGVLEGHDEAVREAALQSLGRAVAAAAEAQESRDAPAQRAELAEDGVDVLLRHVAADPEEDHV